MRLRRSNRNIEEICKNTGVVVSAFRGVPVRLLSGICFLEMIEFKRRIIEICHSQSCIKMYVHMYLVMYICEVE